MDKKYLDIDDVRESFDRTRILDRIVSLDRHESPEIIQAKQALRFRNLFRSFADHKPHCRLNESGPACDCGLSEGYKDGQSLPSVRSVLICPECEFQHIDLDEWATRPHHNHLCAVCGHVWDVGYISVGVPGDLEPEPTVAPPNDSDITPRMEERVLDVYRERGNLCTRDLVSILSDEFPEDVVDRTRWRLLEMGLLELKADWTLGLTPRGKILRFTFQEKT